MAERLRRMLSVLAFLHEEGGATVGELAGRFGLSVDRMRAELVLVSMCGPSAYEPIDLYVDDDDRVVADLPDYLRRPLPLSRAEGLAVLTAGEAMLAGGLAHPAPLDEALTRLAEVLGIDRAGVEVVVDDPPWRAAVHAACEADETVELTYYSAWRDEVTDRRVDPLRVALVDGEWYLDAWDHDRCSVRKFRVSRIRDVRPTGDPFTRTVELAPPSSYDVPPEAVAVRVLLPASAAWMAEVYPADEVARHADGSTELVLAVVGTTWLERLMLRAGPEARVLSPPDLVDLPARAARRLLDRATG